MQHATPTIEPSDEQLRAAWRAMAKPDWGTLEDAARAASHFNLVRAFARRQAMGVRPEASVAAQAELAQPRAVATAASSPPVPRTPPTFDRMRAASGERADD